MCVETGVGGVACEDKGGGGKRRARSVGVEGTEARRRGSGAAVAARTKKQASKRGKRHRWRRLVEPEGGVGCLAGGGLHHQHSPNKL